MAKSFVKSGYTLAEILVTLGVIGVVSAMTLPVLSKMYQKTVVKNQIKRAYNTIGNAINAVATDENLPHGCYYGKNGVSTNNNECVEFFEALVSKLNTKKYCKKTSFQDGCVPDYKEDDFILNDGCSGFKVNKIKNICPSALLNDGTIIFLYRTSEKYLSMPMLAIDVNGFHGPNKPGRDVYSLQLIAKYYDFPTPDPASITNCLTPPGGNIDNFWFKNMSEIMK